MEEWRGPEQVLEGNAAGALLNEVEELADRLGRRFLCQTDATAEEGDAGDVFEEAFGFKGGLIDAGRGKDLRGFGEDGGGVGLEGRHQGVGGLGDVAGGVPGTTRFSRVTRTAAVRTMKETSRKGILNRLLAVNATPPMR